MMGDDDGRIPFFVSDNDLNYEKGSRRSRKTTKEEAMLGIFGGDYSSDEEGTSGRRGSRFAPKKSYAVPIAFVSKGVLDPASLVQPASSSSGIGSTEAARPGLGSAPVEPPQTQTQAQTQPRYQQQKPLQGFANARKAEPKVSKPDEEKLADWDVTGKASMMMKLMGYAGGGLGKEGKGIAEAVSAGPVRPKNMGLAFNNYKEAKTELKKDEVVEIIGEEDETMPQTYWKKVKPKRKKRSYQVSKEPKPVEGMKIVDMTKGIPVVSDNLSDSSLKPARVPYLPELFYNLQTILDLKESMANDQMQRIGYETNKITQLEKEQEHMKLVASEEKAQLERVSLVLQWVETCKARFGFSQDFFRRNQNTVLVVDEENEDSVLAPLNLPYLRRQFEYYQKNYLEEWCTYDLVLLSFHMLFPLMKNAICNWDPISQPFYALDLVLSWKSVLDPEVVNLTGTTIDNTEEYEQYGTPFRPVPRRSQNKLTAAQISLTRHNHRNVYVRLYYDVLLPKLREAFMTKWSPQTEAENGVKLVIAWSRTIPSEVMEIFLEQILMGRLRQEVNAWDPLKAQVRVSDWLHPWINILGEERMSSLWRPVLAKLSSALRMWNPLDKTAFTMLVPWKAALHPRLFEEFLRGTILPKLSEAMRNWEINPSAQDNTVWEAVLLWQDLFLPETYAIFILNSFFPKWLSTLYTWLCSKPITAHVAQWYFEWKKSFPVSLSTDPLITQQFNIALEMMQGIASGQVKAPPLYHPLPLPHLRLESSRTPKPQSEDKLPSVERGGRGGRGGKPTITATVSQPLHEPTTFRQLVEEVAKSHDILFIPTKRSHESKTIFSFGKVSIIIDKTVLLVWKNNRWTPIRLDELITIAK